VADTDHRAGQGKTGSCCAIGEARVMVAVAISEPRQAGIPKQYGV